jgi:hypothetical protein
MLYLTLFGLPVAIFDRSPTPGCHLGLVTRHYYLQGFKFYSIARYDAILTPLSPYQ